MSLSIDPKRVRAVLLADGWHAVQQGTFDLDDYEYVQPGPSGGSGAKLAAGGDNGLPGIGFTFTEVDSANGAARPVGRVSGPLTSVQAVRETPE